MLGQMMKQPLLIERLLRHAAQWHSGQEIVTRTVEGGFHRYTYAEAYRRSAKVAHALARRGIKLGDRVGTLAWNTHRHFELYYGISGLGAIVHTVNPRLFPEQIAYIINHAEDRLLFVDLTFLPLVEKLAPQLGTVEAYVLMTDREHMPASTSLPKVLCYEELLEGEPDTYAWPELDEETAAALCYTSGTTAEPKGVLYSHRSTVLHAYAIALPDVFSLGRSETALAVVPMFHVNAWGLPYAAALTGVRLVLPGPGLDGARLHELVTREDVTLMAGVPTVWRMLLDHVKATGGKLSTVKKVVIGGSAAPAGMIREFADMGIFVLHAWGMTELSPLGTANMLDEGERKLPVEEQVALQTSQGRPIFDVEVRITGADGKPLPNDGKAFGELEVRGPWVVGSYFRREGDEAFRNGWFRTGDVSSIDPSGRMRIVDRSKDVIKSGGEWISSIELENIAAGAPGVAEAAVVGLPHPKWGERPLLVVLRRPGATTTAEEVLERYEGRVAKWQVPDEVVFVDSMPHTATGKLLKMRLREMFARHYMGRGE